MEYLYHYTNLSALAQIVKNKTIRFNSLKNVDDINELVSADYSRAGKYCFVSSWTSEKEESIPMWNMYSNMDGVRIRLPVNPFESYTWEDPMLKGSVVNSYIPEKDLYRENMFPLIEDKILHKVNYTDNEQLLYPNLRKEIQHGIHVGYYIEINKLGKNKNTSWKFQKEWRYILYFMPATLAEMLKEPKQAKRRMGENVRNNIDVAQDEYFLKIKEECINEMEILCAPKITKGDRILLECLIKCYCPNAVILDSILKIR